MPIIPLVPTLTIPDYVHLSLGVMRSICSVVGRMVGRDVTNSNMEGSLEELTEMMQEGRERLKQSWPKSFRDMPEIHGTTSWETFSRQLTSTNILLIAMVD